MSGPSHTVLVDKASPVKGRSRAAPRSSKDSDVTRFRGIGLAALLVLVAVAAGAWWLGKRNPAVASGRTISAPHAAAGLSCDSCHADSSRPDDSSCRGCHDKPPRREPHKALAKAGSWTCLTCHPPHAAEGVTFAPDGVVSRYRGEKLSELAEFAGLLRPTEPLSVTLVKAEACGTCHLVGHVQDASSACIAKTGEEGLGTNLCFDMHTSPNEGQRPSAWIAAGTVARQHPPAVEGGSGGFPWWPLVALVLGLCIAAGIVIVWRGIRGVGKKKKYVAPSGADVMPATHVRLPRINPATCIGCNACVDACPYDVLEMRNYLARLSRPDDCCGLTLCEQRCPTGALVMSDGDPIGDLPRMNGRLESLDNPGVFLAGDLTGLPLIKNAINQGSLAMRSIQDSLRRASAAPPNTYDVVIVGAGPAGISAALEAQQLGLRYVIVDQGGVAESIRSFPRAKLVFDQPLEVPAIGALWMQESTKEELLAQWTKIIHQRQIRVQEQTRVTGMVTVAPGGPFRIDAVGASGQALSLSTRRVLLAFGRRGTPRKLKANVPESMLDHVHYSLADAQSFAGQRVLVVGLGDVAMEAAIALAGQPNTQVSVSYRGPDFKRGKRRNIDEVRRLADAGRLSLLFSTEVASLHAGKVQLQGTSGSTLALDVDAVFVMIGNVAPWDFLRSLGIRRVDEGPAPTQMPYPAGVAFPPGQSGVHPAGHPPAAGYPPTPGYPPAPGYPPTGQGYS